MSSFNGLGLSLGNLSRLSKARTRSISPENFTGEKGKAAMATEGTGQNCARELGQGWKISPSIRIQPGEVRVLADIPESGAIQQMWMTPTGHWRHDILRIYWDGADTPAVECPSATSSAAAGEVRAGLRASGLRQSRQRVQLLLGDAVPQVLQDHDGEPIPRGDDSLLSDQLHTD